VVDLTLRQGAGPGFYNNKKQQQTSSTDSIQNLCRLTLHGHMSIFPIHITKTKIDYLGKGPDLTWPWKEEYTFCWYIFLSCLDFPRRRPERAQTYDCGEPNKTFAAPNPTTP